MPYAELPKEAPPPDRTKAVLGVALAVATMLATYFGVKSPCPECPVCPPPASAGSVSP